MPHIEKLYQQLKGRTDVQVITFNVDDNAGLVGPFLKENRYTFPVIPASFLVESMIPVVAVPRSWIIDASGVLRFEAVGFGGDGEAWTKQVLEALENAKK